MAKTWMITGISSRFGREIAKLRLQVGDVVYGARCNRVSVQELESEYGEKLKIFVIWVKR